MNDLADILACWDVVPAESHPDLTPAGSPERALTRTVITTSAGGTPALQSSPPTLRDACVLAG